jgi:hypothetical protein
MIDYNSTTSLLTKQIEALQHDIKAIDTFIAHSNAVKDTPELIPTLRDLQNKYRELIASLSNAITSLNRSSSPL